MTDLVIYGNRILTPDGIKRAAVLIRDGLIADILPVVPDGVRSPVIDIHDSILMPGIIDPHIHINEPGRTDWEGFDTATRSAIAGGLTTLVDMPLNSSPVTTTVRAFEQKLAATNGQLHANCGFWGGVIPGNEQDIEPLIKKGVLGFKAFLVHSGIDDFPNVTENDLRKAMPLIAKHDLPLLVHCELITGNQQPIGSNSQSYQSYLASRPKKWEDDAIGLMIRLCSEYNCRVHIVHLSSADSIAQIREAKQKGLPLTVETAPHYLYFSAEEIPDAQTAYKCAPPIREKANNDKLWIALQQGIIDLIGTDHSPAPPDLKLIQSGDLMKAWGGIASLQLSLPVMWTAAKKRNIDITYIAKWMCENPARLAGVQQHKGAIAKGFDADLVVWNPDQSFKVTEQILHHRHKITPYVGDQLYGIVEQTWLKGAKVFDKGKFMQLNKGEIITR